MAGYLTIGMALWLAVDMLTGIASRSTAKVFDQYAQRSGPNERWVIIVAIAIGNALIIAAWPVVIAYTACVAMTSSLER